MIIPRGRAHPFAFILGISLITGGILVGLLAVGSKSNSGKTVSAPLMLYCGASMKPAVDRIAKSYEQECGVAVQVQYDASDNLLSAIKLTSKGDVFLPAEEAYLTKARQQNLIREVMPIAHNFPVLVVKKGNPKGIHATSDLLRPDVSVVLANPAAAIGKVSIELLQKSGEWDAVKRRREAGDKVSELGKEPEIANAVKIGAADAGIIWASSLGNYPELEVVRVPLFESAQQTVAAAALNCSTQQTRALQFVRYLTASDRGLLEFKKQGYQVIEGDTWAEHPELVIFAGAMLRPAIADTLKEFEAREGLAPIKTVYNGCGILVGQMRTEARPDAYFACDASFMKQVQNLFDTPETVSANSMVILVAKGNPRGIAKLADLAAPGLKLGIGDEQQCALGWLTKDVLDRAKLCEAVEKNVSVRSPTGDFLVNQMRAGALDAVIVYASNTTFVRDALDVVPVDLPQRFALQPIAVGKASQNKQLAARLLDAIRSAESERRFKENGFEWMAHRP
jgi:molybdate transport system substrate-binding protein